MRRRRKNIMLTCVVVLLAAISILALGSGNIAKWVGNISIYKWSQSKKNANPNSKNQPKSAAVDSENNNAKKPEALTNDGYDVTLSNGTVIKAVYESNGGIKKFKYIDPVSSNVPYSINPSCNAMVIYDSSAQNIVYVDISGKIVDLTRKDYTAHDATVYPKSDILKNNPSYVWCASPIFIDDGNIAYVSQLPWINNQSTKYIWIVNAADSSHKQIFKADGSEVLGQNIKFGNISDKGLGVSIDDKNYFIKSDGSIIE
jgi:hypothetical protein